MYAIRSTLRRGGAAPAAADVQPGAWVQWELRSEPGKLRRWDSVYWGGAEGFRNCSGPAFPKTSVAEVLLRLRDTRFRRFSETESVPYTLNVYAYPYIVSRNVVYVYVHIYIYI